MAAARVRLPAAATPTRSSRLRCALSTTSPGKCSKVSPRTNAGTSANAATLFAARSPSAIGGSDQSVCLQKTLGHFFGRLLVDVHARVQLRHGLVVELGGNRIQRIGQFGILVEHFLAHDRSEVVGRRVTFVVLQYDEIERGKRAVGGER